jgi:hypothetical protein
MRVAQAIIASLALLQLAGGHWGVLQTVAWINMFAQYVQNYPIAESLVKTLDPSKPCSLCVKIREARENEQQSPALVTAAHKIDAVCSKILTHRHCPGGKRFVYFVAPADPWQTRSDQPPHGVPKLSC